MKDVIIQGVRDKNIDIVFMNEKISIPTNIQNQIDDYWLRLLKDGRNLRRGDVFTIFGIETGNKKLKIKVKLTDYAHYMATIENIIEKKYGCKVVHTSAFVETLDNKIIIGEMASNTSTPGYLQFPGGGLDKSDLEKNSINLNKNITKELKEELGINVSNKDHVKYFNLHFLKTGGKHDFYGVIFKVELNLNQRQFSKLYNNYTETLKLKKLTPEFKSFVFLNNDRKEIVNFLHTNKKPIVDYLFSLLQIIELDNKYRIE